jgi:hypothetical protein
MDEFATRVAIFFELPFVDSFQLDDLGVDHEERARDVLRVEKEIKEALPKFVSNGMAEIVGCLYLSALPLPSPSTSRDFDLSIEGVIVGESSPDWRRPVNSPGLTFSVCLVRENVPNRGIFDDAGFGRVLKRWIESFGQFFDFLRLSKVETRKVMQFIFLVRVSKSQGSKIGSFVLPHSDGLQLMLR